MYNIRIMQCFEAVTVGNPNKLSQIIADGIVDVFIKAAPASRGSFSVCIKSNAIFLVGDTGYINIIPFEYDGIARKCIEQAGYDKDEKGINHMDLKVVHLIDPYVNEAFISKADADVIVPETDFEACAYATNETSACIPLGELIATKLIIRLNDVLKEKTLTWLYPDSTIRVYMNNQSIHSVRAQIHVNNQVDIETVRKEVYEHCIQPVLSSEFAEYVVDSTKYIINEAEGFKRGPEVVMGNSANGSSTLIQFAGEHPANVKKYAFIMSRHVAKSIVSSQLAQKCKVTLGYCCNQVEPEFVSIDCFGTETMPLNDLHTLVMKTFKFTPSDIIKAFKLNHPIYKAWSLSYGLPSDESPSLWENPTVLVV